MGGWQTSSAYHELFEQLEPISKMRNHLRDPHQWGKLAPERKEQEENSLKANEESEEIQDSIFDAVRSNPRLIPTLFANMASNVTYGKIVTDSDGKPTDFLILYVNQALEKDVGKRAEDLIGKRITEVFPALNRDPTDWLELYVRAALQGEPLSHEHFSPFIEQWYHTTVFSQEHGYFVTISENITERKKAEEALRESEKTLQSMIDGTPSFIFLKDRDGRFLTINKRLEESLGMKREELRGKTDYDIFPKEVADRYRKSDQQVIEIKQPIGFSLQENFAQLVRKIYGVLNSAVQSHAADWIVDMRGIPGKENPAFTKRRGDTLMRHVEVAMNDLVWTRVGKETLQPVLNPRVAHQRCIVLNRFGWKYCPPQARRAIS